MIKPFALVIAAAALAVSGVGARQTPGASPQDPTFRAGARTVPVYASGVDPIGRFVLDLTKDDFEIRDNGKLQTITQFTTDLQPLTAIVLLDGSRSMANALDMVRTAADHFVVRLMPGDRARIGSFADEIRFSPAFSSDRDELARQVNDLFDLRIGMTTRLLDAIDQAATSFEGSEGRRVVVVFSDGDDTASTTTFDGLLGHLRRADVMVYTVLIRGIARLPEERTNRRPADFSQLALSTGGGYYPVTHVLDDLNSITTEIAEELHSQYVLGFVPEILDGKLHKLEVRVKRPQVRIRARQTYLAERDLDR